MGAAIVAILVCVVIAAAGRGGEMARFPGDYAPPDFGAMAAVDVALLRPPTALWGYHMQVTDEALSRIATAISVRDVRIASLEQQVADLRAGRSAPAAGAGPSAPATQTLPGYGMGNRGPAGLRPGSQEDADAPLGSGEPPDAAAPSRQWAADAGWPGTSGVWEQNTSAEAAGVREDASRYPPDAVTDARSQHQAPDEQRGGLGSGAGSQPQPEGQPGAGPESQARPKSQAGRESKAGRESRAGRDSEAEAEIGQASTGSDSGAAGESQARTTLQSVANGKDQAVRGQSDEEEAS